MPRKIYWKVLTKHRKSAWLGYAGSKHTLMYEKGQKVEALKGSLGCFVFESKTIAKIWLSGLVCFNYGDSWQIVPCHGHGRGKRPKLIISSSPKCVEKFFNFPLHEIPPHFVATPFVGTICFPAITCLE